MPEQRTIRSTTPRPDRCQTKISFLQISGSPSNSSTIADDGAFHQSPCTGVAYRGACVSPGWFPLAPAWRRVRSARPGGRVTELGAARGPRRLDSDCDCSSMFQFDSSPKSLRWLRRLRRPRKCLGFRLGREAPLRGPTPTQILSPVCPPPPPRATLTRPTTPTVDKLLRIADRSARAPVVR